MLCVFISVFVIIYSLSNANALYLQSSASADGFPLCGDCWCATDNNGTAPCPGSSPETSFSSETLLALKEKTPVSIYSLTCNPYRDASCDTTPPQATFSQDDATPVCGLLYPACPGQAYSIVSYASREVAEGASAQVTHEGVCGLCSTAQDLAVYLSEDFTSAGKKCAAIGLLAEERGLQCYQEIGLTLECARIWNFDGIYDGTACLTSCITHLQDNNNGPAPACELNECLQCDEDKAGPIFSQFAARTRRRSGLLSEIIRPCSTIATDISHAPIC